MTFQEWCTSYVNASGDNRAALEEYPGGFQDHLEAAWNAALAAERGRCAKLAEQFDALDENAAVVNRATADPVKSMLQQITVEALVKAILEGDGR